MPRHNKINGAEEAPLAADICCGLGGLSEGLRMAGFDVRLAIDNSPSALYAYHLNHPDTFVAIQDITQIRKFVRHLAAVGIPQGRLGVLAGGTPCQSFSPANSRKIPGRNEDHGLVLEFARLVGEAKPLLFVLENVPHMAKVEGGALLNEFKAATERHGYGIFEGRLWAHEYGVPQRRRRLFLVGSRIGPFEFMPPTHGPNSSTDKPFVTVDDAILGDLPDAVRLDGTNTTRRYVRPPKGWYQRWLRVGSPGVQDHLWNNLGSDVVQRFNLIPQGKSWSQVQKEGVAPENLRIKVVHKSVYRRLEGNEPSVTIVHVRKAMIIHPTRNRLISLREAARLQSFRDRYVFCGGKRGIRQFDQIQQQLGNAVPPLLARSIARRLIHRLHK